MSKEPYETPRKARDPNDLERHILDSTIAKTDAEWWAKRRIEELEREVERLNRIKSRTRQAELQAENDALRAEIAELVAALKKCRKWMTHPEILYHTIKDALAKVRKP